jgi:hypothetical protein
LRCLKSMRRKWLRVGVKQGVGLESLENRGLAGVGLLGLVGLMVR